MAAKISRYTVCMCITLATSGRVHASGLNAEARLHVDPMQALSAFNIRSLPRVSVYSDLYKSTIHSLVVYCILEGLMLNTGEYKTHHTSHTAGYIKNDMQNRAKRYS